MRLILLGPPGAGKGTQAAILADKFNIPHVSSGDIFRHNIQKMTPIGMRAKEFIDQGLLVPNDIIIDIIKERLKNEDCKKGFILDGFPRNIDQADALTSFLKKDNVKMDAVIDIEVDDQELIKRISSRRSCKDCDAVFHLSEESNKNIDKCLSCGGELYHREDDKEEVVTNRLKVYHTQTQPLIEYYKINNLLYKVDGMGSVDEVNKDILSVLGSEFI